ncbi:Fic family protein [Candidatus Micrarchaeota archaeon]|nr:Fic family protein [Candidatus Micrarchaeota archaeon]
MEFVPSLRKKAVRKEKYYYLELTVRADKLRNYSVYLGKNKPNNEKWNEARERLIQNAILDLAGETGAEFLSKEQILTCEILRRRYGSKLKRMGPSQQREMERFEVSNFVYTTLTTEGIPISKGDVERAMGIREKKVLKDFNLDVSLAMAQGVGKVQEMGKITRESLKDLHGMIMRDFPQANPGGFRKGRAVVRRFDTITGSGSLISFEPAPPERIEKDVEGLVEWYNGAEGVYTLEKAALAHLKLYLIHPFSDGNKRMSRLLLNKALFEKGFPILNVSKNEDGYFNALVKSVETKDPRHFVEFVYSVFVEKCSGKPKLEK